MKNAYQVVRDFEAALCEYTGAKYAVTTNSCSMALLLAFAWYKKSGGSMVLIPRKTYPSVPMGAHHAGLEVKYSDEDWEGAYRCLPSPIWDCAKVFYPGMYVHGEVQCVSFHAAKTLKIGQGGAILHDDAEADAWYRRARFDGRTEGVPTKEDEYSFPGWHCYLSPDAAARGLWLLQAKDGEVEDYPDMEKWSWS